MVHRHPRLGGFTLGPDSEELARQQGPATWPCIGWRCVVRAAAGLIVVARAATDRSAHFAGSTAGRVPAQDRDGELALLAVVRDAGCAGAIARAAAHSWF